MSHGRSTAPYACVETGVPPVSRSQLRVAQAFRSARKEGWRRPSGLRKGTFQTTPRLQPLRLEVERVETSFGSGHEFTRAVKIAKNCRASAPAFVGDARGSANDQL